jgi:transcription antitermination factor NusG
MLIVRSKQERKVTDGLQAKGYEVFLPMHTVRRQWSDRLKTYDAPLFPARVFCRFSLNAANKDFMVLKTPGVILIHPGGGKPVPIPDEEIAHLRRIAASQYSVECSALPQTGEVVEIPGDIPIRGVLVERGSTCRVAIGFNTIGHTVTLHIPLADLKRVEGPLTPHWSLSGL